MKAKFISFCKNPTANWEGVVVSFVGDGADETEQFVTNGASRWKLTEDFRRKIEFCNALEYPPELMRPIMCRAFISDDPNDFYSLVFEMLRDQHLLSGHAAE